MSFKVILLFNKQPYLSYRELGRTPVERLLRKRTIFNVEYLSCKTWQFYFYAKTLIMRCHLTILAGIHVDPKFFRSSPGFVYRTQSDPGFAYPVGSSPGFFNSDRSDPIRSNPGFVNTPLVMLLDVKFAWVTTSPPPPPPPPTLWWKPLIGAPLRHFPVACLFVCPHL